MLPLRFTHDALRAETPQPKDVPAGVAAQAAPIASPEAARVGRSNGRIASAELARELGRKGGLARAALETKLRALETLGMRHVAGADLTAMAPFLGDGDTWGQHHITRLARCVGGGECGAGPASLVQSAALALAASRFLYSRGDPADFKLASALANDSRMNLLAAHSLCALEAKSRPRDPMADLNARLGLGEAT